MAAEFITDISAIVREVMQQLQTAFRDELQVQGHNLTGRLKNSIDYEIETTPDKVTAKMTIEDYGLSIEFGVPASRIPFDGTGKKGGTSKYIQGLITFWNLRGLSGREAVSAAFATAYKHKREGMPTRSSSAFSQTGQRTGFIVTAYNKNKDRIQQVIEDKFGAILQLRFSENFRGYENITIAR